jgi:hypothetical protein
MTDTFTVCVTGAAGQIAYSFIPQLAKGSCFPGVSLHLRLLDITPALNVLKGVALEIEDCSFPLVQSVIICIFRLPMVTNLRSYSKMRMLLFFLVVFQENQECREKICYKLTKKYLWNNQRLCRLPAQM